MTSRSRPTFEGAFPNIALWVNDGGMVEVGYDPNTDSFVRAIEEGGMVWSGARHYENLDDALRDLEGALGQILVEKALGAEPSAKRRTTRKTPSPKKAPARRRKGPPEDPMTKQVRKLDAIIQAIRDKERVLVTRLTVVKKLLENPEAASAFALFIARRAQERLRDKKVERAIPPVGEPGGQGDEIIPGLPHRGREVAAPASAKPGQGGAKPIQRPSNGAWSATSSAGISWSLKRRLQGFMRREEAKYWLYQAAAGSRWQFTGLDRQVHPQDRGDCSILATALQDQEVRSILGSGTPINARTRLMITFSDWLPQAAVGLTFTALGGLELWGLKQGIVGGADKPFVQRLCGT